MDMCAIEGCARPVKTRGWCGKHYQRWYNHGDPLVIKDNTGMPPHERFMLKVSITDTCWVWTGTLTQRGYGMFSVGRRMVPAHRWHYEYHHGEVPKSLEIDHLCRVRHCVNPAHLEPVTPAENRARSPLAPERKTHCPYGHPYDEANTYVNPRGSRECRTCNTTAGRRARRAIREDRSHLTPDK